MLLNVYMNFVFVYTYLSCSIRFYMLGECFDVLVQAKIHGLAFATGILDHPGIPVPSWM